MDSGLSRRLKGYLYLGATLLLYAIYPFIIKTLFNNHNTNFDKPFFTTYFCSLFYLLYGIPMFFYSEKFFDYQKDKYTIIIATILAIIENVNCFFFNLGVKFTSVVSNFIIHDTSDVFVFCFCLILLKFPFSNIRALAVTIDVIGVLLVGYTDSFDDSQKSPILGDICSLFSTILYALYTTLTKFWIPDEDSIDWNKFFFYNGLSTLFLMFPFIPIFHFTNIESFSFPNMYAIGVLCIIGIFGYVLPDYGFSKATVLLDPLLVDLALGTLTPLSMIIDYYYENKRFEIMYIFGYILILMSFIMVAVYNFLYEMPNEENNIKCIENSDKTHELISL